MRSQSSLHMHGRRGKTYCSTVSTVHLNSTLLHSFNMYRGRELASSPPHLNELLLQLLHRAEVTP